MSANIKIGIIGCGGIAHGHVRRLIEVLEASVVALNDTSEASIARMTDAIPETKELPVFDDYLDMLGKVELDGVVIATPHTLHFQQAMDSMDHGCHVLLEKPMVCSVEHAKKLIARAQEKNRIIVLSYQRHYQPQFRYIKKAIEEGKIGKVTFIAALQGQGWKKGVAGTWRQDPELSGGGQLNDSGSHLLDIILWITGLSVDEVYGFIDHCGTPVDINSAVTLKFTNGAQGTLSVVGDSFRGFYEDVSIWGENGALFVRNGQLAHYTEDGKLVEIEEIPEGGNPDKNFIDAILGRDEVLTPPECGLRVIELTEAAWKSAELGRPVKVSSL